ncbi:B-cell scaffold protein with ankyrin repeats [Anabas testudineus]|uniref:DBB domain-containing protein n=1 Tax=Anabas testudineus TaxID=64144 RepID=A0A3Q1IMH9_ANATE|nr:B-cell scaffold protein with ankyrin repeats [Anabas testudineus]
MSQSDKELLIIYETEAQQWATYLQSIFAGPISKSGICCYDIAAVSSRRDDFLRLAQYSCKLLILSKGIIEGLCQMQRFFLARVLSPAAHVVVLLCGVESLTPLLELVPLDGDKCLQISSEHDPHEYLSTVTDIVRKGMSTTAANVNTSTCRPSGSEQAVEQMHSNGGHGVRSSIVVVPSRVPCGSSTEVFVLLKNSAAGSDAEIEFTGDNHKLRVTPVRWNDQTLCVNAPDFPAGNVKVTVYSNGAPLSTVQLQYYSSMEEFTYLLSRVTNPVEFMCQAFHVSSMEKLDQKLAGMLLEAMPARGFQGLKCENTPERELCHADVPSLLHFAAQFGFKSVSGLLLQCPGAEQALHTANRRGHTPIEIAKSRGHKELHVLLKETLNMFNSCKDNGDGSVYEMMCTAGNAAATDVQKEQQGEDKEGEEENVYAPVEENDEYDTSLGIIANRPPAPTPRPETTGVKEDKIPYIAQVFQKKKKKKTPQGDAGLYSLSTKQACEREDNLAPSYDTFSQNQVHRLEHLAELQQRVKAGSLTVDDALKRFSNWQQPQKGTDAKQQEKLSQLGASITNSREDNDNVYDKINITHHTPSVTGNESRKKTPQVESDFYSTPQRGSHLNFFWKGDKR